MDYLTSTYDSFFLVGTSVHHQSTDGYQTQLSGPAMIKSNSTRTTSQSAPALSGQASSSPATSLKLEPVIIDLARDDDDDLKQVKESGFPSIKARLSVHSESETHIQAILRSPRTVPFIKRQKELSPSSNICIKPSLLSWNPQVSLNSQVLSSDATIKTTNQLTLSNAELPIACNTVKAPVTGLRNSSSDKVGSQAINHLGFKLSYPAVDSNLPFRLIRTKYPSRPTLSIQTPICRLIVDPIVFFCMVGVF
jgi:hypothetical protein